MTTDWMDGGCGTGPDGSLARFRGLDDGHIEIEGDGIPTRALPAKLASYVSIIWAASEEFDFPAHAIAGVGSLESGWDPQAVSPAGAQGAMQLLPSTARWILNDQSLTVDQIRDPVTNVRAGTKLLRRLWDQYDGNFVKVCFAYNAGSPRCGAGTYCVQRDQDGKCIERVACAPNRWNLVGDGYKSPQTGELYTVDYAGIVIGYANAALDGPFSPSNAPAPSSGGGAPSGGVVTAAKRAAANPIRTAALAGGLFGIAIGIGTALVSARR